MSYTMQTAPKWALNPLPLKDCNLQEVLKAKFGFLQLDLI